MFAELGQGLLAVLVQPGKDLERRFSEGACWAFAAEPSVEPPDRGSHLTPEVGLFRGDRLFAACVCPHRSLAYLTNSL